MDMGSGIAIGLPLGILVAAFYARPVSRVEIAGLVLDAECSVSASNMVGRILNRRYVSLWEFEQLSKRVNSVIAREYADAVLGDAQAQAAIGRAARR